VYRYEHVVIGPANHAYTSVAFAKEHCGAMVLLLSSPMPQRGSRKGEGSWGVVLGTSQLRVRMTGQPEMRATVILLYVILRCMKNIVAIFILSLMPSTALAQSRYWERWNSYSANYDYAPSTTYVNMRSRVADSLSPRIYSFEAGISEEGVSPE
jgi:hypothetical protein